MTLIDADRLKMVIEKNFGHGTVKPIYQLIDSAPTIEPKQGAWLVTDAWPHRVYCSECYKTFAQRDWAIWLDGSLPRNFCPNCGAKMRGVSR